jgi:hypothetical protein
MKHFALLILLAAPAAWLSAQTEQTIIDRAQQPGTPPTPPAQATGPAVSPGDADSGNQRIAEPRKLPFKLYLAYDVQAYHTSNVNLAPSGFAKDDAVILANTLSGRAEFRSFAVGEGLLTPSAGLNIQRYHHGVGTNDFETLDFDAFSIPLTLRYRFGANWEATFGVTHTSIYSINPDHDRIFRSVTPALNLRKLISLGQNHLVSLGGGISYATTESNEAAALVREDRNDKWDYSIDAAYYYLKGKWVVSPYARLSYADYIHYEESLPAIVEVDRRDLTGSIGLSVSYNFTPWASARAFTSFDWRDSQGDDAFDYGYSNTNVGIGATFSASF